PPLADDLPANAAAVAFSAADRRALAAGGTPTSSGRPRPRFPVLDERSVLIFVDGDLEFLAGIHHDRPPPCDWLTERLPRDQEEPQRLVGGVHCHTIPIAEQDEVLGINFPSVLVERPLPAEHVCERGMARLHRMIERRSGCDPYVEVL